MSDDVLFEPSTLDKKLKVRQHRLMNDLSRRTYEEPVDFVGYFLTSVIKGILLVKDVVVRNRVTYPRMLRKCNAM